MYKIAAAIVLLLAVIISGYFIQLGIKVKNNGGIANSSPSESVPKTVPDKGVSETKSSNYTLIIGKIGVSAPIMINTDGNDKEKYNKALEDGVAHLQGSALPGKNGNSFIFGHSSYYADKPGNFKEVFSKLNDLATGDQIEVQSEAGRFVYTITEKKVVEPTDVAVAAQDPAIKKITIMTCWPIGTTKQRLVVAGELTEN